MKFDPTIIVWVAIILSFAYCSVAQENNSTMLQAACIQAHGEWTRGACNAR